jgi:hypothetical protein
MAAWLGLADFTVGSKDDLAAKPKAAISDID